MIVVPMAELLAQLGDTVSGWGTLKLFLFTAAVTPGLTTTLADLTAGRPTWCDPQTMTGQTGPTAVGSAAVVQWTPVLFTNNSGGPTDVYGYAVQDSAGTILRYAEPAPGAPITVPDGSPYVVYPYYSRKNQT